MRRKKIDASNLSDTDQVSKSEPTAKETPLKQPRQTRKAPAAAASNAPEPVAEVAPETKTKPQGGRKTAKKPDAKAPEPEPVAVQPPVEASKPKRGSKNASTQPKPAVEAEPAAAELATPIPASPNTPPAKGKSRRTKAAPVIAEAPDAVVEPVAEVALAIEVVESKPPKKAAKTGKAVAKPVQPDVPATKSRTRAKAPAAAELPGEVAAVAASDTLNDLPTVDEYGYDLPIPEWRPRQKPQGRQTRQRGRPDQQAEAKKPEAATVESAAAPVAEAATDASSERRRKRRRRGGRDRASEPTTAVTMAESAASEDDRAEELFGDDLPTPIFRGRKVTEAPKPAQVSAPAPTPALAPVVPVKHSIEVPESAPQVVIRNGIPTLVRDHRVYPPLMFFGSSSDEKRATTVLEEMKMASEAGVHLHSHLIEFEVDPDSVNAAVGFAAYMLAKSLEVDPQAQVVFRVVFQAPRYWPDRFPNSRYRTASGNVAEPSLCDDDFWGVARDCLEQFVKQLLMLDTKDHVMGVHLERGEWFFSEDWGYDTSKAAQVKFRDWNRTRYGNDEVTLRASWFDGSARFDGLAIPEYQPEGSEGDKFVRSSRKQRRFVDYHLFLSDVTVQRIADLAYAAKKASAGMFLVGVSYGYTFEWSHPSNGHLALGKLLRTSEIDFIAGPPSYRTREPGGSAPFPGPIDSFALNGKLYISEEDFKTSLSKGHEPDDFNPVIKTPQALESIHWRGAGAALAHASGMAWMDLWGNGWLQTNSVWERASDILKSLVLRMNAGIGDPDVAVFIDERALAYLVDQNAFTLLVQNVREAILRAGVNAGFYLLSDLAHREKFPEAKLYIFLNAWDVRPELRAAIKSRLQKDNKVLFWLYAAGLFDAGRDSLERAREVTGIAIKPQPFHSKAGTTILNRRHPLCEAFPERTITSAKQLEPSYFAIPEDATVLGEYTQTGLPSFVIKEFKDGSDPRQQWTSVFLGEPLVNPALIRALAQMAGAHVYNFHEDVVHVRAPFCTVHCTGTGPRTITLPDKWSAYNIQTNHWASVDSSNLRFNAADGSTHVFLVGPRVELEHLLTTDINAMLTIDKIPPRELNLRQDTSSFDVPIMKLDQWMEGSDTDDVADEWFLRPPQLPEEAIEPAVESPEKIGRRRRRRRGGRGNDREDAPSQRDGAPPTEHQFDDLGLNVMFRKRD